MKFPAIFICLAGLAVTVLLGYMIGVDAVLPVAALFGFGAILALVLALRERVWLLLPMFWYLPGNLGFLPLPFNVRELAVLLVFAVFLIFVALRIVRTESRLHFLDLCVLLNLGYLATVYLRNPVGVAAFGSSMVGGRPYFETVIAVLAYIVLTRVPLGPGLARALPCLMAGPQIAVSLLSALTHFLPQLGPAVSKIYSQVEVSSDTTDLPGQGNEIEDARVYGLEFGNRAAALALISYFPPLSLLNPTRCLRFVLFALVCVGFALAGFRSEIMGFAACFLLAAYFRNGLLKALQTLGLLAIVVAGLIGAQSAGVHLPLTAQRALSFLPGDWDNEAKSAAEESSDWRFYMWQVALNSNEFIKNKLLGDGFGFSGYELQIMNQAEDSSGGNGFVGGDPQESYMIVGAFHSGPISAIRYVGWVGLALYLALLFVAARYAWRLIKAAASTPFLPLALFIGLPAVFEPARYIFIYGAFDTGFPETIFTCAMIRLGLQGLAHGRETKRPEVEPTPALAGSQT
jgi:hypothetical protein